MATVPHGRAGGADVVLRWTKSCQLCLAQLQSRQLIWRDWALGESAADACPVQASHANPFGTTGLCSKSHDGFLPPLSFSLSQLSLSPRSPPLVLVWSVDAANHPIFAPPPSPKV
jgi:hypothetical protein